MKNNVLIGGVAVAVAAVCVAGLFMFKSSPDILPDSSANQGQIPTYTPPREENPEKNPAPPQENPSKNPPDAPAPETPSENPPADTSFTYPTSRKKHYLPSLRKRKTLPTKDL